MVVFSLWGIDFESNADLDPGANMSTSHKTWLLVPFSIDLSMCVDVIRLAVVYGTKAARRIGYKSTRIRRSFGYSCPFLLALLATSSLRSSSTK